MSNSNKRKNVKKTTTENYESHNDCVNGWVHNANVIAAVVDKQWEHIERRNDIYSFRIRNTYLLEYSRDVFRKYVVIISKIEQVRRVRLYSYPTN